MSKYVFIYFNSTLLNILPTLQFQENKTFGKVMMWRATVTLTPCLPSIISKIIAILRLHVTEK